MVREAALRRRLIAAAAHIDVVAGSDVPIEEVLDQAHAGVLAATTGFDPLVHPLAGVMEGALDRMEAVGSGRLVGVPTGFADLDALPGGLMPGQLIVLASRPVLGKSTLALDFLRACTIHNRLPAVLFCPETDRDEVAMRLAAAEARVSLHHMRFGNMTDDAWTRVARRMPDLT